MNERMLRAMGLIAGAVTMPAIPVMPPAPARTSGRRPRNGHDGGHRSRT
jgi:hypothetical protein